MADPQNGDLLLWRLIGPPGPPITHALTVAEAARAAEKRVRLALRGTAILPDCLHGPTAPGTAHLHAFRIALDRDGDGRIDHLACHVPGGLCLEAARVLAMRGGISVTGCGAYQLVAIMPDSAIAGPASCWQSVTPFFGPLHSRRGRHGRPRTGYSATEQLARELGHLGRVLPACEIRPFTPSARDLPSPGQFRLGGKRRAGAPSRPEAGYFTLRFAEPVTGPIAAGFGAHFGLGCFLPAPAGHAP